MPYATVSYIPALHKGYFDLFKKYPGALYILGSDFMKEAPRLERDIRALAPEEIRKLLQGSGLFTKIVVINKDNLNELIAETASLVMPEDEVNRKFAETYLPGRAIEFVPTFLRWDRKISTTEFEVPPDRVISEDEFAREILAKAAADAQKSSDWWRQVGAVLVKDGKVLFMRHNVALPSDYTPNAFGDPRSNFDAGEAQYKDLGKFIHAEAGIIAEAAKNGISVEGSSLYVTTFPCPACAKSVAIAGIKEVYYSKGYSLLDAEDILRSFAIKIIMVKPDPIQSEQG